MEVINVLSDQYGIHVLRLTAVLLQLSDGLMTLISSLSFSKFHEVQMPLPYSFWVLSKELQSQYLSRICLICISLGFLPETILTSERGNTARSAQPSSSQNCDLLGASKVLCCVSGRHHLLLTLV